MLVGGVSSPIIQFLLVGTVVRPSADSFEDIVLRISTILVHAYAHAWHWHILIDYE